MQSSDEQVGEVPQGMMDLLFSTDPSFKDRYTVMKGEARDMSRRYYGAQIALSYDLVERKFTLAHNANCVLVEYVTYEPEQESEDG
jgi:hypothetical protein